jgi:inorganic pyrophosphatase
MESAQFIGSLVTVKIDRPLGALHPEHCYVLSDQLRLSPGEIAADGEPLDAYVLGVLEPLTHFSGRCIAVIHRLDDDDDKLVVVTDGAEFSDDEIRRITHFQERFFRSVIRR